LRTRAVRGDFYAAEHLIELGAAVIAAVNDDARDLLRVGNIFERIGGKQQKVPELSFFDGSGLVFEDRGRHELKGIAGAREVLALAEG